jgi:hypothetical protein
MTARARLKAESGYSLIELLISSAIMLTVVGAIFGLMNPAHGTSQAQPEMSDLQQRMRVATDELFKDLVMAGAGLYQGQITGSLAQFLAPVMPRRITYAANEPMYRPDAITLAFVPSTLSQTTIRSPMPNVSAEIKVEPQAHCPNKLEQLCGFQVGMQVLIFDTQGNFDFFTITQVQDAAAHMQHRGQEFSVPYEIGAVVVQGNAYSYYWCSPVNGVPCPDDSEAWQLRRFDGFEGDVPLVDNVVNLQFTYLGDPNPPLYPKPKAGQANCLYDAAGNYLGLPVLPTADGSLAALTPAMLQDGPFCGGGSFKYDVDALRIRKIRVDLRVQVGLASLRGGDATLWRNPGKATAGERRVPDYGVSFEVTPRNLNLAR